jgi:predicted nucleic acid-binding Zn ribbon protein
MRICEWCGGPNERPGPRAKFCSAKCNHQAQAEKKRLAVIAARGDRACIQCQTPIPPEVTGRAKFCSDACRIQWFNRKKSGVRTAARIDARGNRPCMECGQPIPPERTAGAMYCSRRCKSRANARVWRETAPGYMRKYLYGVTPEQWRAAWDAQGGKCAICGLDEWPGKDNRPHTDHDPETGRFRGILCGFCNPGLGMFKHDPARLRAAAAYLEAARVRI